MTAQTVNPRPSDAHEPLHVRRLRLPGTQPAHAPTRASEPSPPECSERANELSVLELLTTASPETRRQADAWFTDARTDDDGSLIITKGQWGAIRWRPGRAVVECLPDRFETLLRALTEFALLESELRRMERELLAVESHADADVALSCRVRWRHRSQWVRLVDTAEELSRLRLAFARLDSRRRVRPTGLAPAEHRPASRLLHKADVPSRMEAFSDRLEACEDLYHGAVDRIAEFRGYSSGEWLEIIIIMLLALEVVVMVWHMHGS